MEEARQVVLERQAHSPVPHVFCLQHTEHFGGGGGNVMLSVSNTEHFGGRALRMAGQGTITRMVCLALLALVSPKSCSNRLVCTSVAQPAFPAA